MLKNYLKIAWRNLAKNKQQTIINLLGLTIGTVSCLTILLYVFAQTGYDEHHENAESIYRIQTNIEGTGSGTDGARVAGSSPPIAFAAKEDFPEIEEVTRVVLVDLFNVDIIRAAGEESGFYESKAYLADSTLFKVFNYKLLEGDPTALNEPSTLILSSTLAKKLFGGQKALDKTVEISGYDGDPLKLTVKGVFDETFGKSHLKPNYIISMNTPGLGEWVKGNDNYAQNNFAYTYLKLKPGTSTKDLVRKFPNFLQERGGSDLEDINMKKELLLQNVTDIHLHSQGITGQIDRVSDIQYLYLLLTLAFFIQLVACINFINLSTARANKRAKEIGVRKVVGADRKSLVSQFLGESLLLSFFSILVSIPITLVLLPFINELAQSNLTYIDLLRLEIVYSLLGMGFLTGLIAGIYPALVLSSIKPVSAIKSTISLQSGNSGLRKGLVVFQFVISITLISMVIIVIQQFNYTQQKNLGYEKNNLIGIQLNTRNARDKFEGLKSEFLKVPGVTEISGSRVSPSEDIINGASFYLPGRNPEDRTQAQVNLVGKNYINTMGIVLSKGRDFRESDSTQIIVNEATLKAFNIEPEDALTSRLLTGGENEFEIVGVMGDFHFSSLKEAIQPLVLFRDGDPHRLLLRFETSNYGELMANLEGIWKANVKDSPFVPAFIDKEVEKLYEEEKRVGQIAALFTILAIIISCLGLFGLVSYIAEQKKKEIGIRKVLGASINSVVQLLTKDFLKLVGIAFLIASPIAYYFMQRWLEDFTYKIEINVWVFVLAGSFALVITLLTVGFQSIKSAVANPVKSLRTE
ncbi:ABC transporter permease [Ulvibacterium marinum]|uniref:ABC transporter permease n=1 Tax=Ulvibacterium marinum TaxID=2419782 RepID=A0A3B0C971_9FLAO|nr:ABC transporter permease [Ulvibacterium marinum]RKN82905.1 ABC transporter permease [Ulvibacterium marinum]